MTMLNVALLYHGNGWPVVPTKPDKSTWVKWGQWRFGGQTDHAVRDLFSGPAHGLAVLTWPASPLAVVDFDGPHGDSAWQQTGLQLPETARTETRSGGHHLIYRMPDALSNGGRQAAEQFQRKVRLVTAKTCDCVKRCGVDLLVNGYFVVPPTPGYREDPDHLLEPGSLAVLPDQVLALARRASAPPSGGKRAATAEDSSVHAEPIPDGARNDSLFKLGCWLRAQGRNEEEVFAILWRENLRRGQPPKDEREVHAIAASACRYPAGTLAVHCTDLGNARRLVALHGDDLRFCHPWGKWMVWDGRRWRVDDTGEARRRAKESVQTLYSEAAQETDDNRRRELTKHALRSESADKIRAMLAMAESESGIAITPEQFDQDPWLFNVLNGTLDLRTGTLRSHDRHDLNAKLASASYDPQAGCPTFEAFLDRIMGGNTGLIEYLQRAIGYALTGVIREHVLHVFYGTGANGKSTFINAVLGLLGPYGTRAASGLLMRKFGDSHPTEVADLLGVRFVASIEAEEGGRLAEVLVKELTGGDRLKARRMREDFWEFVPTHKLFMAVNHRPVIRGSDHAIWRRIALVPFTITISEAEQDRELGEKLEAERSGILNWALAGCLAWQRNGLGTPPEVRGATETYRKDMDVLGDFIDNCCVVSQTAQVTAKELYARYTTWGKESGEHVISQKRLGQALTERGFARKKTEKGISWLGLCLSDV